MLIDSDYENLSLRAEQKGIISHHDFNHHNIYVKGSEMNVVNFEYCCYDIKAYDLVNLIRRKMRKCNWNIAEAVNILNEYTKIEPIEDSELEVMKIMLMFPQKFWRVINKYYNSRRSWSEKSYLTRLQEVLDERPYLEAFLEEFNKL
jgi:spore coat protein I